MLPGFFVYIKLRSWFAAFLLLTVSNLVQAAQWTIPVAGNAYRPANSNEHHTVTRDGTIAIHRPTDVYEIYFRVDRPCDLQLSILAKASQAGVKLQVQAAGKEFDVTGMSTQEATHSIGTIQATEPGYVQVKVSAKAIDGQSISIRDLIVQSDTADVVVDYVRSNEGNMFYWGRRGPSVHLRYRVPKDTPLQYAYSEVTVPEGQDIIGSYFMANGFGEGYFGMQVNSPTERRVLFSVWSPFSTDNPRDIPKDQQVLGLAKGPEVKLGEFGNEGSGGQSYLIYPWKAGVTYRFLTEVKPDGNGSTRYTCWFGPKDGDFRLIASFSRPKTNTTLKGFHSFLEDFAPETGNLTRQGFYGNVWVRDIDGNWHECTEATFSVDPTGKDRHRMDYTGGSDGNRFFMKNCGFFAEPGRPGDVFTRTAVGQAPTLDFTALGELAKPQ